jgi:hypothetical protein
LERSKNFKRIMWVVKAALLLALVVVAQTLSKVIPTAALPLISQLVTGSLVNLVLIVGAGSVGFSGTAVAAVLSPVLAYSMGQMIFPQMIPVIAVGNLIIVAVTWAFFHMHKKLPFEIAGIIIGAAAKCAFLWIATAALMVPIFYSGSKVASKLSLMFSWPQGLTALIGGILALLVLPAVRAYQKRSV